MLSDETLSRGDRLSCAATDDAKHDLREKPSRRPSLSSVAREEARKSMISVQWSEIKLRDAGALRYS